MNIQFYKPYKSAIRLNMTSSFEKLSNVKPEKKLITKKHRKHGRNNQGIITIRHRGGGHKRRYRLVDFKRNKLQVNGKIISIEYDPNRNTKIALVNYQDGDKRYILYPKNLRIGDSISNGVITTLEIGNTLPLEKIPLGTVVHNVELEPNKGGQLVRSAGTSAKVLAKRGSYVTLRLPSKEIRLFRKECFATIGELSNNERFLTKIGKAGRTRWLGKRPSVRGSVMNPCDHPHGGGEGRTSVGRIHPITPWGKPALGIITRKVKKVSDMYILRRRT